MKKKILFVTALFAGSLAFAQGTTTSMKNKKGLEVLPQAGDWAIQMNAVPLLNFGLNAVNIMNNTGDKAQHPGYAGGFNNVIVGKMYTSATEAWRVKVGITFTRNTTTSTLARFGGADMTNYTQDSTGKVTNLIIGFGKEYRRGHNRLQGFYGYEALLTIGSQSPTYTKAYSLDLETAATTLDNNGNPLSNGNRVKETSGSAFGIGARGFVGVDYFVLPKIAIGAEFGWGLGFVSGSAKQINEVYNGTEVIEVESLGPKTSSLSIGNDTGGSSAFGASASLNVSFYF